MSRASRIVLVTAGLAVAGAVLGAVAGATAFAIGVAITQGLRAAADPGLLGVAAVFGAIVGAVTAPAASWLLLRRVPLGRTIAWTTVLAVGGGTVGWLAGGLLRSRVGGPTAILGNEVWLGVLGALLGFVAAAAMLRRRANVRSGAPGRADRPGA